MAFFTLLPLEIRSLVYEGLISTKPKSVTSSHVLPTTAQVNCSIDTPLLLVSKRFSEELISALTVLRVVRVDVASVYDPLDELVALWPHIVLYPTHRLCVHINHALALGFRMQWKQQYPQLSDRCGYDKVTFLVEKAAARAISVLEIMLDVAELQLGQVLFQKVVEHVCGGKVETGRYRDRWNGYLCHRMTFVKKHSEHRQLSVELTVRYQT